MTAGASLRLQLPAGAVAEPSEALPAVDVANLPGATVPVRAGYTGAGLSVRVVCATAPSRGWAPGVEGIVMARASQIAQGALGGAVTRFAAEDTAAVGPRFEQRFTADVQRGGATLAVAGRHVLGFAGEARAAVVCSVVCAEAEGHAACGGLVAAATPEGAWTEAPPPSLLVRGILLAAEAPGAAAAIVGAVLVGAAALVIARRPRPRA